VYTDWPRTTAGLYRRRRGGPNPRPVLRRAGTAAGRYPHSVTRPPTDRSPRPATSRLAPARIGILPLACVLGVLVILGVAGLTWNVSPYYGRANSVAPKTKDVGSVPVQASPVAATLALSPNRIAIPRLKATAPVVDVGTTSNGELEVPENPKVVGWWSPGAKPGAAKGTAILAGHINFAGVNGTLARIGVLKPGDEVDIYGTHNADGKKMVKFAITGVRTYHKTALPYKQIFDQTSIGRLAIVTCGGPFDASTGNYLDNIVAFAVPA
jgi:hypothetical protein